MNNRHNQGDPKAFITSYVFYAHGWYLVINAFPTKVASVSTIQNFHGIFSYFAFFLVCRKQLVINSQSYPELRDGVMTLNDLRCSPFFFTDQTVNGKNASIRLFQKRSKRAHGSGGWGVLSKYRKNTITMAILSFARFVFLPRHHMSQESWIPMDLRMKVGLSAWIRLSTLVSLS